MNDHALNIRWYRTPVVKSNLQQLNRRDNVRGLMQAGGHLLAFLITGTVCLIFWQNHLWVPFLAGLFLHGCITTFMVNANHELVHGTVFSNASANRFFLNIFAFLTWENPHRFWGSHTEHHKFTLHPPADREEVLPIEFTLAGFLLASVFNPVDLAQRVRKNARFAFGHFDDDWDAELFAGQQRRHALIAWSRGAILLHAAIACAALTLGHPEIILLVTAPVAFGGLLFFLCNNSQHAGLSGNVPDFRLCCRTIYLNPLFEFFYWYMNYHTEHHMYPAVPCYKLRALHKLVKHDLPHTSNGVVETWQQILAVQYFRRANPDFQFRQPLPGEPLFALDSARPEQIATHPSPAFADCADPARAVIAGEDLLVWECTICGFIYDEAMGMPEEGIAPGTRWQDIAEDWSCPDCGIGKADFVMVQRVRRNGGSRPTAETDPTLCDAALDQDAPIVIVGSGMAGVRLAAEIRQHDERTPIMMFTHDSGDHYLKPDLSKVSAIGKSHDEFILHTRADLEQRHNIHIHAYEAVQAIDPVAHMLRTGKRSLSYRALILATGAQPARLPYDGDGAPYVHLINDLESFTAFRNHLEAPRSIIIIGAGLIGCEYANALLENGHRPIIVDRASWPLVSLVPESIGAELAARLSDLGAQFHFGTSVTAIHRRDGGGYICELADGDAVECDLMLQATGVRPRSDLAAQASLDVHRGVVVNAWLESSAPGVYALGDCAEIEGRVMPFVQPIVHAAKALALTLTGRRTRALMPDIMPVLVKTPACPIAIMARGEEHARWDTESRDGDVIARRYADDGALVGIVASGAATRHLSAFMKEFAQQVGAAA